MKRDQSIDIIKKHVEKEKDNRRISKMVKYIKNNEITKKNLNKAPSFYNLIQNQNENEKESDKAMNLEEQQIIELLDKLKLEMTEENYLQMQKELQNLDNQQIEQIQKNYDEPVSSPRYREEYSYIYESSIKKTVESRKRNKKITNDILNEYYDHILDVYKKNKKHKDQYQLTYISEIYETSLKLEASNKIKRDFITEFQTDINQKMRATLVNWMINISFTFKLRSETFFLSINILDRYLSNVIVNRDDLQLICVSCLFIASKKEEIEVPDIEDYMYLLSKTQFKEIRENVDLKNNVCHKHLLTTEKEILKVLDYELYIPSVFTFYQIENLKYDLEDSEKIFGLSILYSVMIDSYVTSHYSASMIASSTMYIVLKKNGIELNDKTGYKKEEMKNCIMNILFVIANLKGSVYESVLKNYNCLSM